MSFRSGAFYKWTGTPSATVATKLQLNTIVWKGKYPVDPVGIVSSGGAPNYSYEQWLGFRLSKTHTKIANARITKIHGAYDQTSVINAGADATFAAPVNTVSAVATLPIPTHFKPTTELTVDFDTTLNEYQFLVLQVENKTGASAYDPREQEGQAGYPLIQVAFDIDVRDSARMNLYGANAPESVFNRTGTNIFIVDEYGDMQLAGCFSNEVNFNGSPEWTMLLKGALQGAESYALNKRNLTMTGTIYSMGTRVMEELFHGENRGSDGRHTEVVLSSDWKPVETREVLLVTYSDQGRELIVRIPNGALRATGEIAFGQDNTNVPFEIVGSQANLYFSDNLMDVHYFAMQYGLS